MFDRVAVVDTSIENYSQLVSGLDSDVRVLLIDSTQDGWLSLSQQLQGLDGIASLHIFSHGGEGRVQLGGQQIDASNLSQYASVLADIGGHLSAGADVLLYGCSVGAGQDGQSFIEQFSAAVGADVAASDDLTGSASLGGDWTLETSAGQIEAVSLTPESFEGVLPSTGYMYDGGFEYFNVNGWSYYYGTPGYWTFSSASGGYGSGLADNGSPWFAPNTPYGTQAAFLQSSSGSNYAASASSNVYLYENGSVQVGFAAVGRSGYGAVNIEVRMDGQLIGTISAASQSESAWTNFTVTNSVSFSTGWHNITFTGRGTDYGDHASAIDNIQITALNDAPYLQSAQATLGNGTEDTAYVINQGSLLQGWADMDGGSLSVQNLTASNGSLVNNGNGAWTLTPTANFNGTVTLNYNVSDGQGGLTATSRSFSLAAVNDAPVLTGAQAVLPHGSEDAPYTVTAAQLLEGYTDPENNTLTVGVVTASHGLVANNGNGTWTFTPDADYFGPVQFSYTVQESGGQSVAASLGLTLDAVNDAPTGVAATVLADGAEDAPYSLTLAQLLAGFSDVDGDSLSVINLAADHGSVADNGDNTWTITPEADYYGTVQLSFDVTDGHGGSVSGSLDFNLNGVPDDFSLTGGSGNDVLEGDLLGGVDFLSGMDGDDELYGYGGDDHLDGGNGDDRLDGGAGADLMEGGAGNDYYIVDDAGDAVKEREGEGIDTVESQVTSYTLKLHVENLLLGAGAQKGGGTWLSNVITGNALDNELNGGSGQDTLYGLAGNDRLNGGQFDDLMEGGLGDDYYYVDHAGDQVVEQAGEGIDTVRSTLNHTLAAHVENLLLADNALLGTGNDLNNLLTGNQLNNTLSGGDGHDQLDGKQGADLLIGGQGDDHYYLDQAGDQVNEQAGEGYDTVHATFSYTLGAEVERLELSGWSMNGTGNGLDNTLIGSQGANILDGGAGADWMQGGKGGDTYIVDHAGDQVIELANEGVDTVQAGVSYTLLDHVENLTLTGAALNGTGNTLANTLTGNSQGNLLNGGWGNDKLVGGDGDDILIGDDGADTLIGGTGSDQFVFTGVPGHGADTLSDFQAGVDDLVFDASVFSALGVGPVSSSMLRLGQWSVRALDADDHLLFNQSQGKLYYDPDGNGAAGAVHIATLQGVATLNAADISAYLPSAP